jgi:hypothetical protein
MTCEQTHTKEQTNEYAKRLHRRIIVGWSFFVCVIVILTDFGRMAVAIV